MKATPEHRANLLRASSMRLGLDGYCRVLAAIRYRAMSSEQIAVQFNLNRSTAVKLLRWMLRLKLVHRVSWYRPVEHSRLLPMWRLGANGDVPMPIAERPSNTPPNPMLISLATVIQCLQESPQTIKELAADLGVHPETSARIVSIMRSHGLSHIQSWQSLPHGPHVAAHGWLGTADAPTPGRAEDMPAKRRQWRQTHAAKVQHLAMIHAMTPRRAELEAA